MGSAQGPVITQKENIKKAEKLGIEIANANCILVNGACPGLPDDAARGAKKVGGFVLGISPAFSLRAHREKYLSPDENYDLILFTGLGLMERDIVNIRSSDAIIIVGGGIGTLNEFTVAYEEGKVIGVLKETGGISDNITDILKMAHRDDPKEMEKLVFESDPKKLVATVLKKLLNLKLATVEDARVISRDFNPFS